MEELLSPLSMESATVGLHQLVKLDEACGASLPWTVFFKKEREGFFVLQNLNFFIFYFKLICFLYFRIILMC
jgi:hypothetical protein